MAYTYDMYKHMLYNIQTVHGTPIFGHSTREEKYEIPTKQHSCISEIINQVENSNILPSVLIFELG
jgi:hypothetical protein